MDAMSVTELILEILALTIITTIAVCEADEQDTTSSPDYEDVLLRLECANDDDYEECAKDTILPNFSASSTVRKKIPDICELFQRDLMIVSGMLGAPYEEESVNMVLVWKDVLELAAAALLRATLLSEGYSVETIELRKEFKDLPNSGNSLTVEVNLVPKLYYHARLAPTIYETSCASNASNWQFYKNESNLKDCRFLEPGKDNVTGIDFYILKEHERYNVVNYINNIAHAHSLLLNLIFIDRYNLTNLIQDSNSSFLFLDIDRESYKSNNDTIVVICAPGYAHCALDINEFVILTVHGKMSKKLSNIFKIFSLNEEDLDSVINLALGTRDNVAEAACKWGRLQLQIIRSKWKIPTASELTDSKTEWVAVVLPLEENRLKEYLYLMKLLQTTRTFPSKLKIKVFIAQRFDSQWFFRMLIQWFSTNNIPQLKGAVISNDMAADVGLLADKLNIPLFTYDVSSKPCEGLRVVSATGRQTHLELGLRRLFADCGWQRLAVLSEPSQLFAQLADALLAPAGRLVIREERIKSNLQATLRGLKEANVRVILVNTGATMASVVLAAAQNLNMTRNAGFLWIVREYNEADNATAAIRPISVSFWWRGNVTDKVETDQNAAVENKNKSEINKTENIHDKLKTLRTLMEKRWSGRAWPLHAAPLVDALLSLGAVLTDQQTRSIRAFWNIIRESKISGLVQELIYETEGVKAPLIFVEEWGSQPRPRSLAIWRGGEKRPLSETCPVFNPPSDGSIICFKPEGDPFQPTCRDTFWITSITSITFVTMVIISLAVWGSRRALTLREHRFKTEFTKRLLARRERIFAALAEHLVERVDLELQQELGTGRFGCVKLGVLRERKRRRSNIVVAAKALREDAAPAEESEFLKEACVLAELRHEHIVRFVGVCVVDGPPLLLMEHAFFGDLLRYLQTRRHLAEGMTKMETTPDMMVGLEERAYVSAKALTKLAQEAAAALDYLAQRNLVHRDVRASNCLVDERRSLKLADFGLARTMGTNDGEYASRRRGLFPVLWMAPESLASGVSSASSDVWAFGVLVFELVTLGRRPYGDMPPPSVLQYVVGGGRPQLPWDTSADTRALLRACWNRAPEQRPQAAQLQRWLTVRHRALRPALAPEMVDVDNEIFGDIELDELDLSPESIITAPGNKKVK